MWALGVSFYCMATGKVPFNANSIFGLQSQLLEQEPDWSPIEDANLVDLLKQMLRKDQNERATIDVVGFHPWVTKNGEQPLNVMFLKSEGSLSEHESWDGQESP